MTHASPKFVLIEQSLREVGGHYFEYASEVLRAAEAAGYQPVLATHRQFAAQARMPRHWHVRPLFPYVSDRIHRIPSAYSFGLWRQIAASRGNLTAIFSRIADACADRCKATISHLRWWRRFTRVRAFASACDALFRELSLKDGDQVLCSTMSDMDLLGLVRFLKSNEASRRAQWHLQFHFSVFCGRDPDYAQQERNVAALRRRMKQSLACVPDHRLHFYTTTDELGRQFNRLNVAPFQTLPWPVGGQFHASSPKASGKPLRVLCAGAVRREKGSDHLGSLAKSLWIDLLNPGAVQLLFQVGPKRRARTMLELPANSFAAATDITRLPKAPLVSLPHPLQPEQYAELIKSADIGLLLYNSDVYFARCSGILAELLAAGVPVIAPAGCWLAEQISEQNYLYLDGLTRQSLCTHSVVDRELHWHPVASQRRLRTISLARPSECQNAIVRLWRPSGDLPGSYLRVQCEQLDRRGKPFGQFARILGHREGKVQNAGPVSALFHLDQSCASLRLTIAGAYHNALPQLENSRIDFIPSASGHTPHRPAGSVGLTMGDVAEAPALLRDLVLHYDHYRAAAQGYARHWAALHAPQRTIEHLASRSHGHLPARSYAA